jgi:serine/threonine protein kinase
MKLQIGQRLRNERYEIQELLRSPRDKEVYRAYDRVFDRQVTLDVFSSDAIMPSGLPVGQWEARVLDKLGDHRNIARVYDYWQEGEAAIMATRYLPGGRLEELITDSHVTGEAFAVQRILQLSTELADGLSYIHQCRLLYLDLQPHNVLFDEWGTPRLVDFDTAVSLDECYTANLSGRSAINYMAPELIEGQRIDERTDLYSLGATIYEMCEGHPALIGTREQIVSSLRVGPPSLERHDLPAGLRELVLDLLASDRHQRPAGATEVKSRLVELCSASENLERLLGSNVGTVLKKPLEAYLKADGDAFIQPRRAPNPDDHGFMMQAIIALAETDYRRAVIDAATATEMTLRLAIAGYMQQRGRGSREIEQIIWEAKGLDGLFTRYSFLNSHRKLPVSYNDVEIDLAKVRNEAAHNGRIPVRNKAIQAVEVAYALVNELHPFRDKLLTSGSGSHC